MSQKLIVLVSPELVKSANLWSAKCAEGYQKDMVDLKHLNPKKKLVLSGVSALFACSGAPRANY